MHRTRWPRLIDLRTLRRGLGVPILLFATSAALAQQATVAETIAAGDDAQRYTVEIVLFAYSDDVAAGGEVYPPDDAALPEETGIDAAPDAEGKEIGERPVPEFSDRLPRAETEPADTELEEIVLPANIELTILGPDQLTLQAEYDKLSALDAYRPVLWTGWTQRTFDEDVTPEIRLRRLGRAPLTYDGAFKLYLSRFLHLVVDLNREAPQIRTAEPRYEDARNRYDYDYPGAPATRAVHYRIHEDRIFKNGDIRYFDHPKFGLLAKVTRIESPEPGLQDPAQDEPPASVVE